MESATYQTRLRVNVERSVKGIFTFSCTVEMLDYSIDEVLKESDRLVAALRTRYPGESL